MAKGAASKEAITEKILEIFPGSFIVDKLIRIPMMENDEPIEIKVTLTAAKDIVGSAASGTIVKKEDETPVSAFDAFPNTNPVLVEPTEQEKKNVMDLLASLGL